MSFAPKPGSCCIVATALRQFLKMQGLLSTVNCQAREVGQALPELGSSHSGGPRTLAFPGSWQPCICCCHSHLVSNLFFCYILHHPLPFFSVAVSLQEEEEQEEEDEDEDEDDTDDLDELDTDQLLEADLEEEENNENAGEEGENDFSPSDDEELANLLEEGDEGEEEDSDADEEVELILGDSKYACGC